MGEIGARIRAAARRLGVVDPAQELGAMLGRTFARPAGDPAYRKNWLQPGALPLEWSFTEADPDALRIEFQPFDPDLPPEERLRRATRALLPVVEARHGKVLARQFEAGTKGHAIEGQPRLEFGAFVGLAVRPDSAPAFKIYVEIGPEDRGRWCDGVLDIAGVVPHFRSIAVDAGAVSERVYFLCRDGLSVLDLEPLCAALDMAHRFPALLLTTLELTGGAFYLPPRSVLLGIRRRATSAELKVELVAGLAAAPEGLAERVERLLDPAFISPFRRWTEIVHPKAPGNVPISIVSIRVTAAQPACLSVYAAEAGREP